MGKRSKFARSARLIWQRSSEFLDRIDEIFGRIIGIYKG